MKHYCLITVFLLASFHAPGIEFDLASLADPKLQQDFPDLALDAQGRPWLVYIEYNGIDDVLKLARHRDGKLEEAGVLSERGVIHGPRITRAGASLWVCWSQLVQPGTYDLLAREIRDGKISESTERVATNAGNNIFADIGADAAGRVWLAWQAYRGGAGNIHARYRADGNWSKELQLTEHPAGDWMPRIAFGPADEAVIVFDSHRDENYDIWLARVNPAGDVQRHRITDSPAYEARPSIGAAPDGSGFWIAWERGLDRWGFDRRSHNANFGLNANKQLDLVFVGAKSWKIEREAANIRPLVNQLARKPAPKKAKGTNAAAKRGTGLISVNSPEVFVGPGGAPWLSCRYTRANGVWRIALSRYELKSGTWKMPQVLPQSSFGQERPVRLRFHDADLWAAWPSDARTTKKALVSHVHLGRADKAGPMRGSKEAAKKALTLTAPRKDAAKDTPERPRDEHRTWELNGKTYTLVYGDFHRHTSVSNCRTVTEGSIIEQFRYAQDAGKLDYLGTSDHTDIGKYYAPYEWWENQKLADLFQVPGWFNSFYVYEREQKWPWGHRNVVFADRGGPIVYIKRKLYQDSPWAAALPVEGDKAEIQPQELWNVLRASGKRVAVVSHTGATGMGTNWDLYKEIDGEVEDLVEIYQSARVSYEGLDAPQPTVGFAYQDKYNRGEHQPKKQATNFGGFSKGVYQNALKNGLKLGVFTSSDHISTHTSYGGAWVENFSRHGVIDAMDTRRTMAATDKIFVEFSCNGHPMGSIFDATGKPEFTAGVYGTGKIRKVTLVRNEKDYRVFEPKSSEFKSVFSDEEPVEGENRYYLRVEQADGNMAWVSPVWVNWNP